MMSTELFKAVNGTISCSEDGSYGSLYVQISYNKSLTSILYFKNEDSGVSQYILWKLAYTTNRHSVFRYPVTPTMLLMKVVKDGRL